MTLPFDVPVLPDAEQGRAWARAELAGPGYARPGLLQRAVEWLLERLHALPVPSGTGSALTAGALLVVLAGLVAWVLWRAGGPLRRRPAAAADGVFGDEVLSAAAHRAAADAAAAAGDFRTAVLERFRAVARELEEQGVVGEQPGRTATETADLAGERLPHVAGDLRAAARLFGDVRYGDHEAGPAADATLTGLDRRVRTALGERVRVP